MTTTPISNGVSQGVSESIPGNSLKFLPESLFKASEAGHVIDMKRSKLWVDQARTIEAVNDGDLVWWMDDLSGNGKNWGALNSSSRGILRVSGNRRKLETTSGGVIYTTPAYPSSTVWTNIASFKHVDKGGNKFGYRGTVGDGQPIFIMGISGNGSDSYRAILGTPSYRIDGSDMAISTREQVYSAIEGQGHVVTVEGYTYTGAWLTNQTSHLAFHGGVDQFDIEGDFYGDLEISRALTVEERTNGEHWASTLKGVSL